jgi:hypothetical protein
MFLEKAKWKLNELRQGDVLAGVPFPFTSVRQQQFLAQLGPNGRKDFPQLRATMRGLSADSEDESFFTGQVPMKLSFCAVLTQCCELACNTKGRLRLIPAVSVCRLVPLTASIKASEEKLKSIRANTDSRNGLGYKNYFYYGSAAEFETEEELMADFSQTACIPAPEFPDALSNKIIQLDDRHRMKFKIKLGVFYAAATDEEIAQGIHLDPWKEPDTSSAITNTATAPDLPRVESAPEKVKT